MGDLDNDMDELFRKAANHYPLKTDGADWDKVMGKLPDAVSTPLPLAEPKKQLNNRKLLWLILLFPMGWLCNSYYNGKNNSNNETTQPKIITSTNEFNNNPQINKNQSNIPKEDNGKSSIPAEYGEKSVKQQPVTQTITDITKKETAEKFFADLSKKTAPNLQGKPENTFTDNDWHVLETEAANGLQGEKNKINLNGDVANNSGKTLTQPLSSNQSSTDNKAKQADITQTIVKLDKDTFELKKTDTSKSIVKKTVAKKSKGFYMSAIGGLDASSVRSQGIKKAGYSYGMLIGYQFNKHMAVETGLLWDKKQYYTDGEYFNKTRTDIPTNYAISDIYGNCSMFEVPVDFRYNFAQNKKRLFFATAGLSSYFMKKEAYNYEAAAWGATWPAMKTYNNSGSNLFSVVNLSIGLEHKIGKSISVRINPYLKIPLKGLGIGSIPITSSGVNIGITIPFHK